MGSFKIFLSTVQERSSKILMRIEAEQNFKIFKWSGAERSKDQTNESAQNIACNDQNEIVMKVLNPRNSSSTACICIIKYKTSSA